jgi:hypothetical protein
VGHQQLRRPASQDEAAAWPPRTMRSKGMAAWVREAKGARASEREARRRCGFT